MKNIVCALRAGRVDPAVLLPVFLLGLVVVLVAVLWPRDAQVPGPDTTPVADNKEAADKPGEKDGDKADAKDANPVAVIETSLGDIKVRLFKDKAPKTAENFIDLVEKKFYDGIIFHRVIGGFMAQVGDPLGNGTGGRTDKGLPRKFLPDEFHPSLKHNKAGLLSMANSGPNTGDTQFFITFDKTPHLDNKHAIFGEVIEGMDVVREIEQVKTGPNDKPLKTVKIVKAYMVKPAEEKPQGGAKVEPKATVDDSVKTEAKAPPKPAVVEPKVEEPAVKAEESVEVQVKEPAEVKVEVKEPVEEEAKTEEKEAAVKE